LCARSFAAAGDFIFGAQGEGRHGVMCKVSP
jgi:hypothetical protein